MWSRASGRPSGRPFHARCHQLRTGRRQGQARRAHRVSRTPHEEAAVGVRSTRGAARVRRGRMVLGGSGRTGAMSMGGTPLSIRGTSLAISPTGRDAGRGCPGVTQSPGGLGLAYAAPTRLRTTVVKVCVELGFCRAYPQQCVSARIWRAAGGLTPRLQCGMLVTPFKREGARARGRPDEAEAPCGQGLGDPGAAQSQRLLRIGATARLMDGFPGAEATSEPGRRREAQLP
jgi:hypothetical protein